MKIRVGTDIEQVERFRKRSYDTDRLFYHKVFSKKEIEYCLSKPDPSPHFAGRFAAKEALIKAIPQLKKVGLADIDISLDEDTLIVSTSIVNSDCISVSISHTSDYATACAIFTGEINE